MVDTSNHRTTSSTPLRKIWHTSLLILVLALCAGGVSPALGAGPSPGPIVTQSRFYIEASLPHQTLCAGQKYPVKARVRVEKKLDNGDTVPSFPLVNIPVDAESSDTSIATIDPASQIFITPYVHPGPQALDPITFNLQAKKAGPAAVFLNAKLPPVPAARGNQYLATTAVPFEIRNCAYEVTVTYWWKFSVPQASQIWNSGFMTATITADSDPTTFGGDGTLKFRLANFDLACAKFTEDEMPIHITGIYDHEFDQMALTFEGLAPSGDVGDTCPNSFLVANAALADPNGPFMGTPVLLGPTDRTRTLQLSGTPHISGVPASVGQVPLAKLTVSIKPVVVTTP